MFDAGGDAGVAFFFILSGFVLCAGYSGRIQRQEFQFSPFICRRIKKLYPLHIFCLIWFAYLCRFQIPLAPTVTNALMIQSWIPLREYYFSGNSVSWCLSDFMFYYLLFPVLLKSINRSYSHFIRYYLIIVTVYLLAVPFIPEPLQQPIIYINPAIRLLDFISGILLWHVYESLSNNGFIQKITKLPIFAKTAIESAAVALLIVAVIGYKDTPVFYATAIYWWLPSCIIILTFSTLTGGGISKLLQTKALVSFGDISFTFYLIHVLGIRTVEIILNKCSIEFTALQQLVITLTAVILIALILHPIFEKKLFCLLNLRKNR